MGWQRKNKDKAKKMRSSKEVYKSTRKPIAPGARVHKSRKDYDRHDDTSLDDHYTDQEEQLEEDNELLDHIFGECE